VGFYNPKTKEKSLDTERITHWIGVGAKPSGTVHNMLIKEGIIKGDTINVLPQKSPVKKEELKEASGEPQVASSGDGAAAEESGENKPPTEGAEAPKAQADQPAAEKKEEPEQNKEELKQESEEAPAQEADGTEEKKVA
jgi:small subunit ribosomal protein S16